MHLSHHFIFQLIDSRPLRLVLTQIIGISISFAVWCIDMFSISKPNPNLKIEHSKSILTVFSNHVNLLLLTKFTTTASVLRALSMINIFYAAKVSSRRVWRTRLVNHSNGLILPKQNKKCKLLPLKSIRPGFGLKLLRYIFWCKIHIGCILRCWTYLIQIIVKWFTSNQVVWYVLIKDMSSFKIWTWIQDMDIIDQ